MILPKSYVDDTCGVRPEPNMESFNNIVFLFWYAAARVKQGTFSNSDLDCLIRHLRLNNDGHGLYKPKNSHDNVTYKMLIHLFFHIGDVNKMNYFKAIFDIGIFRIWDVITYGAVFGPKSIRFLFYPFLIIPALQMIEACAKKEKIRPKMFGDGDHSRINWWFFKGKKVVEEEILPTVTIKTWKLKDGSLRYTRHMQNDGKHISIFRLMVLKEKFFIFRITAKICRRILINMMGEDYTYVVIKRYFQDQKHPVIAMWKGHGDVLCSKK